MRFGWIRTQSIEPSDAHNSEIKLASRRPNLRIGPKDAIARLGEDREPAPGLSIFKGNASRCAFDGLARDIARRAVGSSSCLRETH